MNTKQSGFAHAFLIIGLIVALIGALGFVFWQNFIYKEPVVKNEPVVVTKKDKTEEQIESVPNGYTLYKDEKLGFSLAYPTEWGELKDTQTQSSTNRMGANGVSTKAVAGTNGGVRIAVYTKDSFFTKAASGYTTKYQGDKVVGADAGSEVYETLSPLEGTNVYTHNHGDTGFVAYDLFFKARDVVVYVNVGDSKDKQLQIAKAVKVF